MMDKDADKEPCSLNGIPEPGHNCWHISRADRAALVIDAADYFRRARQAMMRAEKQILLIGWDFDTRIDLVKDKPRDGAPTKLGPFLSWLARTKPDLNIFILKWDVGALKLLGRGTTILRLARWISHKQIHFKLDGAHPVGASHHQKIIVVDDALAFCGGIDMTGSRWDTRAHLDKDPRRRRPVTRRRYLPWHDASMVVDGAAAKTIGELSRHRWEAASGERLPAPEVRSDPWPEDLPAMFSDVDVAVARTRGETEERKEIREIEALFVDQIRTAKRFIYAETQYFASRVIAQEIAQRLAEPNGPEIVLINPDTADTWLQEEVMGPARAELIKALAPSDHAARFRIYTPVTEQGEDIYVHAKIMIVDDEILRVGSANMNNRSMGLDSECDLAIDARLPANHGAAGAISDMRNSLMAEHLGVEPEVIAETLEKTRSLIAAVEALRGKCRTLRPFEPPKPNKLEKTIAKSEALDPERPEELLQPRSKKPLLDGVGDGGTDDHGTR